MVRYDICKAPVVVGSEAKLESTEVPEAIVPKAR